MFAQPTLMWACMSGCGQGFVSSRNIFRFENVMPQNDTEAYASAASSVASSILLHPALSMQRQTLPADFSPPSRWDVDGKVEYLLTSLVDALGASNRRVMDVFSAFDRDEDQFVLGPLAPALANQF